MNDSSTGGYIVPSSPAPAEDAAFDAILQGLVSGVTGLPSNMVRPRWQLNPLPQPEPTSDWCSVGVVDEDPDVWNFSYHDYTANDGNGQTITETCVDVRVLASFYGPTARGNANLLRDGLMVPQNTETLLAQNLRLREMPSGIQFVPSMINERTYARADIHFRLARAIVRTWPILNIETIQGSITSDDGDTAPFQAPAP